jgi:type III secretory pathway component EscS
MGIHSFVQHSEDLPMVMIIVLAALAIAAIVGTFIVLTDDGARPVPTRDTLAE